MEITKLIEEWDQSPTHVTANRLIDIGGRAIDLLRRLTEVSESDRRLVESRDCCEHPGSVCVSAGLRSALSSAHFQLGVQRVMLRDADAMLAEARAALAQPGEEKSQPQEPRRVTVTRADFEADPPKWVRMAGEDCIVSILDADGKVKSVLGGRMGDGEDVSWLTLETDALRAERDAAIKERDEARGESARQLSELQTLRLERLALADERDQLAAACAAMRGALEIAEKAVKPETLDEDSDTCFELEDEYQPDEARCLKCLGCALWKIRAALAPDAGRELLARLERAEAERDEWHRQAEKYHDAFNGASDQTREAQRLAAATLDSLTAARARVAELEAGVARYERPVAGDRVETLAAGMLKVAGNVDAPTELVIAALHDGAMLLRAMRVRLEELKGRVAELEALTATLEQARGMEDQARKRDAAETARLRAREAKMREALESIEDSLIDEFVSWVESLRLGSCDAGDELHADERAGPCWACGLHSFLYVAKDAKRNCEAALAEDAGAVGEAQTAGYLRVIAAQGIVGEATPASLAKYVHESLDAFGDLSGCLPSVCRALLDADGYIPGDPEPVAPSDRQRLEGKGWISPEVAAKVRRYLDEVLCAACAQMCVKTRYADDQPGASPDGSGTLRLQIIHCKECNEGQEILALLAPEARWTQEEIDRAKESAAETMREWGGKEGGGE